MLQGVKIKQIKRFCDDRGFLCEVQKQGEETAIDIKQTTYTETYPGVIKAFHWHKNQTDAWFVVKGEIQIVMHDLRQESETKGQTQVVYAGESNPVMVVIPPGVAHGYRVLGTQQAGLFYHTDQIYDPANPDEERIPFDDPGIGFVWETVNK